MFQISSVPGPFKSLWGSPRGKCWPTSACALGTGPSRTGVGTGSDAELYPCSPWTRCWLRPTCNCSATACSCRRGSSSSGSRRSPWPWTTAPWTACAPSGSWTWRGRACWNPRSFCTASRRSSRKPRLRPFAGSVSGRGLRVDASKLRYLATKKQNKKWMSTRANIGKTFKSQYG